MLDSERLICLAAEAGLDLVGAVPVQPSPGWQAYADWASAGYAADMAYLTRTESVEKRRDPRSVMPTAKSVLVAAASYAGPVAPEADDLSGRVARYAWHADYHVWMLASLKQLVRSIEAETGVSVQSRCYVDTGPILERAWAQAAGLGWLGKNGCLIHPTLGSFLFLGVALVDIALTTAAHGTLPTCGSCTACLEACPTGALLSPGVLDARRCISYLTIEHRGDIPPELYAAMGDRVFGCDVCQDVCPWNRRAIGEHQSETAPSQASLHLPDLLEIDVESFRERFRSTSIWRATPEGLARNAAIVLSNSPNPSARAYLDAAAKNHPSPLVRRQASAAIAERSRRRAIPRPQSGLIPRM